jgi:hypothetical protein
MAINVPINTGGILLRANSSTTGSFGGMLALQTGSLPNFTSSAQITGLRYINGINPSGFPLESSNIGPFNLSSGTKLELVITSCSLGVDSAPVFLYY